MLGIHTYADSYAFGFREDAGNCMTLAEEVVEEEKEVVVEETAEEEQIKRDLFGSFAQLYTYTYI